MSLMVVSWVTGTSLIDIEGQVDPYESFAQVKNITLLIAKNKETYKIPLDQFFRGQNLKYDWELSHKNGTILKPELAKSLISITKPIQLVSESMEKA